MKTLSLLICLVGANLLCCSEVLAADPIKPVGEVQVVGEGYSFTEGPAWHAETETLFFSDIPNTKIYRVGADGKITVFTDDSKFNNGILIDAQGRVLGCQMEGQVVQYDLKSAKATKLASAYQGTRFNAPNDLVVDPEGGIYFTDPLFRAPQPLPQGGQYVYYIAGDGTVSRVTEDLAAPNGIGLSPDAKRLYVCPSRQSKMLVYDVLGPGKLSAPREFCDLKQPSGKSNTGADGIVLDMKGNVYITTHLGVQIYSPAGEYLGVVQFPQQPANVCFGGKDWKTMYVTARTGVYSVRMPIAGLHPETK